LTVAVPGELELTATDPKSLAEIAGCTLWLIAGPVNPDRRIQRIRVRCLTLYISSCPFEKTNPIGVRFVICPYIAENIKYALLGSFRKIPSMINPFDLTGKTILVTGASRGIGQVTAVFLSRLGARIVAVARDAQRLQATVEQMEGTAHLALAFDLNNVEQLPAWIKTIAEETGPLFGLVHSAGITMNRPLKGLSYQNLLDIQRINVDAAIMLSKGFRQKGIADAAGSSVVYLSSVTAFKTKPALAAYAATKGALISLTKTLALELAAQKIRVNCVCPGLVRTAMVDDLKNILLPEQLEKLYAEYPLGLGEPEDVAYAIAFLLAPAARWITGTALVLDGGYTA
jgi:NAD(P)-dependent dehydrogenase (short-subunit alcohol dehydrogenase family)